MKLQKIKKTISPNEYETLKEMINSKGWSVYQKMLSHGMQIRAIYILSGHLDEKTYKTEGGVYSGIQWCKNIAEQEIRKYELKIKQNSEK